MKKIIIIFGTRPEAIKLCPLVIELKKFSDLFDVKICVTAQHRQMLDQILKIFEIKPDYDLNLMKANQTLFEITSTVLIETGNIIKDESPDMVIVQGDTTTTFASSLAAYYHQVKVGHVEAGLRTYEKYSPFPEEINRKLTGGIADIHFAATKQNQQNLIKEGIDAKNIFITGNTVIDSLLWMNQKIREENKTFTELNAIDFTKKIILITGHRRENFGQGFVNVCNGLKEIALNHNHIELVYPVHMNPNVQHTVFDILSGIDNIKLIDPLDYEPFVFLMNKSYFIISDSGGIQEEAPSLGKPVLLTRDTTERPEAVSAGVVKLVGTSKETIVLESEKLLSNYDYYSSMANIQNPYGTGHACEKIAQILKEY